MELGLETLQVRGLSRIRKVMAALLGLGVFVQEWSGREGPLKTFS